MQRKQGSPLSGSITEARGFISGKICRGNYDSAVYMENADGGKVILWVRVPHSPILVPMD